MTWPILNELWMLSFLLILARCLAFLSVFPAIGDSAVPALVKIGAAGTISILLVSTVQPIGAMPTHWLSGALLMMRETLLGLLMGSLLRFAFMGAQFAGQAIGVQMGLGAASLYDPGTKATVAVSGRLYYLMAILLFISLDMHHAFIEDFGRSFRLLPLGEIGPGPGAFYHWAGLSGRVLVLGLRLSLPVIGALLLLDVALGFMARLVPQMNIFLVGFPLKIALGFMILALGLGGAGRVLRGAMEGLTLDLHSLMSWMR